MPDDDRLLVRPYVAPSGPLPGSSAPVWPDESGRITVPTRFGPPAEVPGPSPVPVGESDPAQQAAPSPAPVGERRGSRLPFLGLALLALGAAGALAFLLRSPDREPPRAVAPPGLSVPVLPARSPEAVEEPTPAVESVRPPAPGTPSATAPTGTAQTPAGPSAGPSRDPKPTGPTGKRPTARDGGTLSPGDRGAEVRALQERLHAQGFTYVSVTGVYDGQTRRGVLQLQQNRSIEGDPPGIYGPVTRAAFPIED
ncbi:peptidoglycan-binding protein [Streptomyces sp. NPDC006450]|uniref:peptidoglycan-binding domain-containing protein n=1 Tax=Streptomyces sp. NPDC006450 TaxID=3155458 RepID=UPI0033B1F0B5